MGPGQKQPAEGAGTFGNLPSDLDAVRAAAVSHLADGIVSGYAPDAPTYSGGPGSFNRAGGKITITRSAVGTYKVRFAGLSALLGTKSTVQVTAGEAVDSYCKPVNQKLINDIVNIKCFDASSGSPADAVYLAYVTKNYNNLAFAFANLPTSTNYAPPGSASFNPAGAIRVFRSATGTYSVKFKGFGSKLTTSAGDVQINAVGSGAQHCKVGSWGFGTDVTINVYCFARTGAPKDVPFNVLFVTPKPHLAYAWADQPTASSYKPSTFYSSNPAGTISITRLSTGLYDVTFNNFDTQIIGNAAYMEATAYGGSNVQCKVAGGMTNKDVAVYCFTPSGPADSYFTVMYLS